MTEARSERRVEPGSETPQAAATMPLEGGRNLVPALQPGTRFGDYLLLEKIGEGGVGVVFRARQTGRVERHVAVKFLRPGSVSDEQLARFELVAEISERGVAGTGRDRRGPLLVPARQ